MIITSQIDLLFELGIPFARLAERARVVELDDFSFKTASVEDLLIMKKQRTDPDESDRDDIRFLENLLKRGT